MATSFDVTDRIIGVVTVRQGIAVQSFGYERYLPLGNPVCLVENFDRWGADEIILQVIDRHGMGPDLDLLQRMTRARIATPITYGGGIATADHAVAAVVSGADRVTFDALAQSGSREIEAMASHLGAQALIAVVVARKTAGDVMHFDYRTRRTRPLPDEILSISDQELISEVMVVDADHEGEKDTFCHDVIDFVRPLQRPIITFGGLGQKSGSQALADPDVAAIAVGNSFSYTEHALQHLRRSFAPEVAQRLRPPRYSQTPEEFQA